MGERRARNTEADRQQNRRYYAANAERIKEQVRKRAARYRAAHPEREKARHGRYKSENPERYKKAIKNWRANNPRRESERRRRYWEARPERHKEVRRNNVRKRRARRAQAEGHHTADDIKALWLRQRRKCAVTGCKHPISDVIGHKDMYHVDHIVPLKPRDGRRAGTNWPDNLQILCRFHNGQKRNKDPYEWAQEHGFLFL